MKQKLLRKEPQPAPRKPNLTGIPIQTKLDFEARSGLSFDDIRVHYHSPEPARLGARAFTDGRDVYLAPREEGQLPHELGHVIQRRVRTVLPTRRVAGVPVNDSPALEREADQFAAGRSLPGFAAGSPSPGCVQRMSLKSGKTGGWAELTQELPAEQKVLVRRILMTCAGPCSERSGLWTLDEGDLAGRPATTDAFYLAVTPHMMDKLYWINYTSYATGDLSSLAAAVINDPRHGIYMYWSEIGESNPAKNAELLRQFLGGVVDPGPKAEGYYIVTDNGAQGLCPFKPKPWGKAVAYGKMGPAEQNAVDLQEAAFHYLSCGKQWRQTADMLVSIPALHAPADEAAHLYSAAMYALSAALDHPLGLADPDNHLSEILDQALAAEQTWLRQFQVWQDEYFSPNKRPLGLRSFDQIVFPPSPENPEEPCAALDSIMAGMEQPLAAYPGQPSLRALAESLRRRHRAQAVLLAGCGIRKWFAMETPTYTFQEPRPTEGLGARRVERLKFSAGTQLVAIGWNREKRSKVRRAWGVGEEGVHAAPYDADLEAWLRARGIDPEAAVRGKPVVVLWIRKSGERGGAHFENDTSFRELGKQARQYLDGDRTVFLTGDEKAYKAEQIAAGHARAPLFNVTQFWTEDSPALRAWGGNTRTGQFRLYDYLKRRSDSLLHVGAMSGNLEAMSLLGYSAEVRVNSPYDSGVSRMQAYSVHDLGRLGAGDHLSYQFTYVPYGKKAAAFYVMLSQRTKKICEMANIKSFSDMISRQTFGSLAASLSSALPGLRKEREDLLRRVPPPEGGALARLSAEISEKEELQEVLTQCTPKRGLNLYRKDLHQILFRGLIAGRPFDALHGALGIEPAAAPDRRLPSPPEAERAAYLQALSHLCPDEPGHPGRCGKNRFLFSGNPGL